MMDIVINTSGTLRCIYSEEIDLTALGPLEIQRASHVEPDEHGLWWADLSPMQGPLLGPFDRRSEALAAEVGWLEEHILSAG